MFQLVQRGIALTPAEKMRAMSTEWATFTRQFEDDYELIVNLSKQNRASGFRLILTIFTMIQEIHSSSKRKKYIISNSAPILQASPQALLRILDDKKRNNTSPQTKIHRRFRPLRNTRQALLHSSNSHPLQGKPQLGLRPCPRLPTCRTHRARPHILASRARRHRHPSSRPHGPPHKRAAPRRR